MVDRHQSRILAMQALCQLEVLGENFLCQLDEFLAEESAEADVQAYARKLVCDVHEHRKTIDDRLQDAAANWLISRMATVDRNILRTAACELICHPKIPSKVAINEAVEIAKAFGTAESPGFINGVLDAVAKSRSSQGAS